MSKHLAGHRTLAVAGHVLLGMALMTAAHTGAAADECRWELDLEQVTHLMERAREVGTVRVIVGLAVDWAPEARLESGEAVDAQRSRISSAQDEIESLLEGNQVAVNSRYWFIPSMAMNVDESALSLLSSSPLVCTISEDIAVPMALAETIPLIGADNVSQTGYGWAVAVLDTGVDTSHSFFDYGNRVVAEACFSTNDPDNGYSSLCPGGGEVEIGPGTGVNYCDELQDTGCIHGTHVAGIAAGSGSSFSGVAPAASIVSIQVYSKVVGTVNDSTSLASDQLDALQHVHQLSLQGLNIASVNLSLGTDPQTYVTYTCDRKVADYADAVEALLTERIPTIAAAGNREDPFKMSWPACMPHVISVGNSTKTLPPPPEYREEVFVDQGTPPLCGSGGSHSAYCLDLLAPGSETQLDCDNNTGVESSVPGGWFMKLFGTSMSTPHVAGAWALLRDRYPRVDPEEGDGVEDILTRLIVTGRPIFDNRNQTTKPRIQVNEALDYAVDRVDVENDVWVDFGDLDQAGGRFWLEADGSYFEPWETLTDGVQAVPAHGTIRITNRYEDHDSWEDYEGDCSRETITITKAMTIQAIGGPISIGSASCENP